jgi:hypothetical protein
MKNKKGLTKILIVVVAGLWAYNIYNTIQNQQLKNDSLLLTEENNSSLPPVLYNKDSFDLVVSDYDPFLEMQSSYSRDDRIRPEQPFESQRQNSSAAQIIQPNPSSPFQWPKLTYLGFVKNHSTNHQLCLLKFDNQLKKMAVGDEHLEISLIAAWKDSALFQYQDQKKIVLR